MLILFLILGAMIFLACVKLSKEIKRNKRYRPIKEKHEDLEDYQNHQFYQRKLLFTKHEYYEFTKLAVFAKTHQLEVLAKVRLLDLIEPRPQYMRNKKFLYKIQAKHVDFVVTDTKYRIVCIIELDDSSHDRQDRFERDVFVDTVLRGVGYQIIHTRSITEDVLQAVHFMAYKSATPTAEDQNNGNRTGSPEQIGSRSVTP